MIPTWRKRLGAVMVLTLLLVTAGPVFAKTEVQKKDDRFMLVAEGKPFFVKGMAWRPPASFDDNPAAFWRQSEEAIDAVFAAEAPLMKQAGLNTLRFTSPPPVAWIDKLYERYGLRTMLTVHAASTDLEATVGRYAKSKGLLAWVVVGTPTGDQLIATIKKRDPEHAVGLHNAQLSALTMPGAPIAGADFFVVPSLAGPHADAFARARTHLQRPLLLWSLSAQGEQGTGRAAQPRQWHQVYRHAVDAESTGTAIGGFSAEWCREGASAICTRKVKDGRLVAMAGPDLPLLGRVHGLDVFAAGTTPTTVDTHFSAMIVEPPSPDPDPAPTVKVTPDPKVLPRPKKKKRVSRTTGKPNRVRVHKDPKGMKLVVDGRDMMVYGVNWGYVPIGTNYGYDVWRQSDAFIRKALADEMPLLKKAGFNAIRQYDNIPPRWVKYIYETYGIYTMVNHLVGRYGFNIDGVFVPSTDYSDPKTREAIKASVRASAKKFANVPGVLLFLLGNENNYGLSWTSFEIEDLPEGEEDEARADSLYSLFGELIDIVHAEDENHPVSIANGDVQYIDVMAKHCKGKLDIFGTNVYRGNSVRDMFEVVKKALDVPVMFTEFGADAYNAADEREDHLAQAAYLKEQWREIYEQSYGHGRVANSIGGFVFQWVDGWWKYKQEVNLDVHDTNASWATAAYPHDFREGQNNMNEEWFGICAKGKNDGTGHFPVYPRAAYYVLRDAFKLDPYAPDTNDDKIEEHFDDIEPYDYDSDYMRAIGAERTRILDRVRLSNVQMKFETFTTGGTGFDEAALAERSQFSNETRFGHLESFFVEAEVQPIRRFNGKVSFNIFGNVPSNPMQEIFYEARGQRGGLVDDSGQDVDLSGLQRLAIYQASFDWDESWFNLSGYYRTGHYHWIDEGDFFNIYGEANYGPWLDVYNGQAPFGAVFEGKKGLQGLKIAAGPQMTWGANPAVIAKYSRDITDWFRFTMMHQEEIAQQAATNTSAIIPQPLSRKSALSVRFRKGGYELKLGGLSSGSNRIGREFVAVREGTGVTYVNSGFQFIEDEIRPVDTLGAKARFQADWTPVKFYAQGGYKGLVADSGWDQMPNYTNWSLRESGRGNQYHAISGMLIQVSDFQIAPNFLFQKPLEGPLPRVDDFYAPGSNTFYPGVRPRDIRSSPFVVQDNRETYGFEMILAYDPTPGTWLWNWDNIRREDADFTASVDFVYRIQPTARDSAIGFTADGQPLVFGTSPPATNVWLVTGRTLMNLPEGVRLLATLYGGEQQGNAGGTEVLDRKILRGGGGVNVVWDQLQVATELKLNDWGPYDYHRDFNITFPVQIYADASYGLQTQEWLIDFISRMGMSYRMRFLDEFSIPVAAPGGDSYVWEVRSYINFGL